MTIKQSIKEVVDIGATVKFSFKSSIDSWFSEYSLHKAHPEFGGGYYLYPTMKKFENIDEAVDVFCEIIFTSKNIGYAQDRLRDKGIDFENDYDLERPTQELIELFEQEGKLIDEEYKEKFLSN